MSPGIKGDLDRVSAATRELIRRLMEQLDSLDEWHRSFFQVDDGKQGMYSLTVSGLTNHRREVIIDIFRWLANNSMGSYGLLFVRDDEDSERDEDYANVFRVFRLSRGKLVELDDPFLSPYHETIYGYYETDWAGIWHAIWHSSVKTIAEIADVPPGQVAKVLGAMSPFGVRTYW